MHKSDKKRVLNIVLIPDSQDALPKTFRVSYTSMMIAASIAGVIALSLILGMVTYSQVLQAALERDAVKTENSQLREQLEKGQRIEAMLDTLKAYREKIRSSLQGYVKIADRPDESLLTTAAFQESDLKEFSIFTNVPLKTPVSGFVSRGYAQHSHTGIDIVAPEGTPINAAAAGVCVFSGWTNKRGNTVILYHPRGYLTYYQHNARNVVSEGQSIQQGDIIGFVGNSGETSSGPHLHFEIWKDGAQIDPGALLTDLTLGE